MWGVNMLKVTTCYLDYLQLLSLLLFLFLFLLSLFLLPLGHRIHLPGTGGQQVEVNQKANS
ncbi:MAG: hypothetical protein ACETVV_01270 [Nitrososphaeria archaeon]